MTEKHIFKYRLNEKAYYLCGDYAFTGLIVWLIIRTLIDANGWLLLITAISAELVVLLVFTALDHRSGGAYPVMITIDNSSVTLFRIWDYQTFELSDVIYVQKPVEKSLAESFLKYRTQVVYTTGSRNREFYVSPRMPGYEDLLLILASRISSGNNDPERKFRDQYRIAPWVLPLTKCLVFSSALLSAVISVYIRHEGGWAVDYALAVAVSIVIICFMLRSVFATPQEITFRSEDILMRFFYRRDQILPYQEITDILGSPEMGLKLIRNSGRNIYITPFIRDIDSIETRINRVLNH
jgi:hypothetical protein